MGRALLFFLANHVPHARFAAWLRRQLFCLTGMKIGRWVVIYSPFSVTPLTAARTIVIGKRSFLNANVRFGGTGGVTIGEFCQIGANVCFETVSHDLQFTRGTVRAGYARPIRLGDHVWIGSGAIILPGVSIGDGAVVGAGAIVTRDVPAMTVVAGNPARIIRTIEETSLI
jgi:maltose O-acetyltransferase